MGASVFGGVNSDKIFLNDATLWSGGPVDANMNPDANKTLPALREALKNDNYKLADELNKKLQGAYSSLSHRSVHCTLSVNMLLHLSIITGN